MLTSLEFERILSASGPTLGHLERPSDGKEPKKIAWLQCVGSRDTNKCGNGYCSSVCCMYAIKEAMIAKEHAHGDLDCAVFNMDIRSFGKDYEKYYLRAKDRDGVRFVKARIHTITDDPRHRGICAWSLSMKPGMRQAETFDMVVLSVGLQVSPASRELAQRLGVALNPYGFAATDPFTPVATSRPGVYACGIFQGPKDIPASVTEASAAASAAGANWPRPAAPTRASPLSPNRSTSPGRSPHRRVCLQLRHQHRGHGGRAGGPGIRRGPAARRLYADENLFTCSQDTQEKIKQKIQEHRLNRLVVAACSPKTHAKRCSWKPWRPAA